MKRPIRVLLLCDRLDIAGGVERFVCAMANHLSREGMEVAVGSVSTRRASVRYPLDAAVRVLTGEEGRTYEIEASSDLVVWTRIGTAVATSAGVEVADDTRGARRHRFFRARLVK